MAEEEGFEQFDVTGNTGNGAVFTKIRRMLEELYTRSDKGHDRVKPLEEQVAALEARVVLLEEAVFEEEPLPDPEADDETRTRAGK